jgi:hypothetical protein
MANGVKECLESVTKKQIGNRPGQINLYTLESEALFITMWLSNKKTLVSTKDSSGFVVIIT